MVVTTVEGGIAAAAAQVAARLRAGTVEVHSESQGHGSGVIWRPDGLIITNNHVLATERPYVVLADGRDFAARILYRDPDRDLAALQIAADGLPAVPIGGSTRLRPGDLVLALGHPLGIKGALSLGIVHAETASNGPAKRWIQADVRLAPGNSGGPLANAGGEVIGINTMIAGGLALAVPSDTVTRFVQRQGRSIFLGVQSTPVALPAPQAQRAGQQTGLLVLSVLEGSPAARSGLLPGDILLAGGDRRLQDHNDLVELLRDLAPGTPLPLRMLRGGVPGALTAILALHEESR